MIAPPHRLPHAILFDMDGTLTEPLLDFPAIKAELNIGHRPILEALADMDDDRRAAAETILDRHERRAAESSTLNPGCEALLQWLADHAIPTAVITRNSRACAQIVAARHGLTFDTLITREDGPFKPDPAPLLLACRRLNVAPADAWMVGDGQYDVEAGHAAGVPTVWLSHGRARTFAATPWRVVDDLTQLIAQLKRCTPHR
jgi:HAD superfamily hydrolase (TIGR01509 family)